MTKLLILIGILFAAAATFLIPFIGLPAPELPSFLRYGKQDGRAPTLNGITAEEAAKLGPIDLDTVEIDIKPGDEQNTVSLRAETVPVAILSERHSILRGTPTDVPDWIAPKETDQASLTFGRTGEEQGFISCDEPTDVNGDGLLDLICHFDIRAARFEIGTRKGILHGQTVEGSEILATQKVRIVDE